MLGPIRLAWWRERLEELDAGASAPAEPRLQQVEHELLPRGISGHDLAGLEPGWLRLFDPFPWGSETSEAIWMRGKRLFGMAAILLGTASEELECAGGVWALVDVARHCSDARSRALLLHHATKFSKGLGRVRFPGRARPISVLGMLAMRDCGRGEPFEPEGMPARAAAMLWHRLTGRLPRVALEKGL
jgi:phytoene synthase